MTWVTRSKAHYEATYYRTESFDGRTREIAMDIFTTNPRHFTMQNPESHENKHGLGPRPQDVVESNTYSTFAVVRWEFVRTR